MNVYVLRNNLTKTYGTPLFRFEDFKTYSRALHDFVMLKPDEAAQQDLNISSLHYIGTYDVETGKIDLFQEDGIGIYNVQEAWEQLKALKEQVS